MNNNEHILNVSINPRERESGATIFVAGERRRAMDASRTTAVETAMLRRERKGMREREKKRVH